jgi:ABC-type transporter lipoprotein component MlaA
MALAVLLFAFSLSARAQGTNVGSANPLVPETVILPKSVPDPIEPFNRAMWDFNKGFMRGIVNQTSRV